MKKRNRNIIVVFASVVLVVSTLFFVGRYLIFRKIRTVINEQLQSLRDDGIYLRYETARFNVFTGKIEVYELKLEIGKDSVYTDIEANVPYLLLKGIQVVPFMLDNSLNISEISIQQPTINYRMSSKLFKSKKKEKMAVEKVNVNKISLSEIILHVNDTTGSKLIADITGGIKLTDLGLKAVHDSLVWRNADLVLNDISITLPEDLYKYHIKHSELALSKHTFRLDSMTISPMYDRRTFMRKYGKQTDRIGGVIAYLDLKGLSIRGKPYLIVQTKTAEASMHLNVYRDKRFPFKKDFRTALPAHFLQRMPVQLKADTVFLKNSFVSYEEFPEEGDSTGRVFFDKLNATIFSLHNDPQNKSNVEMKAYAKFMGKGDLSANFTFPGDTTKPYKAHGSLKNLPLVSLNNILGSAAKARIESGTMTNLKFHFAYNMYHSDGEVELNYENLRISSLRENKDNEQAVSFIKTLLLNTFIIKKNMNEDVSDDKKTGTISFTRDTRRSLFNYWWKSILSGIKSAYKLDKLPINANGGKKKKKDEKNS